MAPTPQIVVTTTCFNDLPKDAEFMFLSAIEFYQITAVRKFKKVGDEYYKEIGNQYEKDGFLGFRIGDKRVMVVYPMMDAISPNPNERTKNEDRIWNLESRKSVRTVK
jgi:hypothetical protein